MMIAETTKRMISYYGKDVRRINHALKVWAYAITIYRNEGITGESADIIELAAILHDIGIPVAEEKYASSAGKYQELEGPPIADKILKELDVGSAIAERTCHLIGHHHSYSKIDGIDFQILVEADFLVNIFEDEMNAKMINTVREKYFRTKTGRDLLDKMYLAE